MGRSYMFIGWLGLGFPTADGLQIDRDVTQNVLIFLMSLTALTSIEARINFLYIHSHSQCQTVSLVFQ
jgi:hypothetical protein